jgi:hypothetical protein
MSLKHGEVNPLSVLKVRKLNFIPHHFAVIKIKIQPKDIKLLDIWINYHLNSRYAITKNFTIGHDNKMVEVIEVGMEDPKELTMLTLSCPHLT